MTTYIGQALLSRRGQDPRRHHVATFAGLLSYHGAHEAGVGPLLQCVPEGPPAAETHELAARWQDRRVPSVSLGDAVQARGPPIRVRWYTAPPLEGGRETSHWLDPNKEYGPAQEVRHAHGYLSARVRD